MPEDKGDETTAAPIELSEDGKTLVWHSGDEDVSIPVDKVPERFNKAKLADKHGEELGKLRTEHQTAKDRLQDYEALFGDAYERISKAQDPDAELAKFKSAMSGEKPKGGQKQDEDPLAGLFGGGEKDERLTLDEVKKVFDDNFEKKYTSRREQERAQDSIEAEIRHAMDDNEVPKELRRTIERETYLDAVEQRNPDFPKIVKEKWEGMLGAVEARKAAMEAVKQAKKDAAGGSISDKGHPVAGGDDPRAKMPLDSKEYKEYAGERTRAIFAKHGG